MATDIKAATAALFDKVSALKATTSPSDSRVFQQLYDEVNVAWERLRDLLRGSQTSSIANFFDLIGHGLIDAQKRLDAASEEYVRSAMRLPRGDGEGTGGHAATAPALPTMFRIPKVNAELKCSLETNSEKKL